MQFVVSHSLWRKFSTALILTLVVMMSGCSAERFLQSDQTLLSDVKIQVSDGRLKPSSYKSFVRQHPNSKWFNVLKIPLGIYCLSSADSIKGEKGMSKMLRRMGEAPVVYEEQQTIFSKLSLEQALKSEGYLHAKVDTLIQHKKYKTKVTYSLYPGDRFYIQSKHYYFDSPEIRAAYSADSSASLVRRGNALNLNILSDERSRVIRSLRNRGYYYLNNDFVSFDIDTIAASQAARLTLHVARPVGVDSSRVYVPQRFGKIKILENLSTSDSVLQIAKYQGISFYSAKTLRHSRRLYASHVPFTLDSLYRESYVQSAYGALNALPSVSYTSIRLFPSTLSDSLLDCDIYVKTGKVNSVKAEIEGTNTAGDLGAAMAFSYSNRNLLHGAEQLTLKIRGAYEAITGLEGYANQNYIEWSGELSLRFPTLLVPFFNPRKHSTFKGTSAAQFIYDSQDRPEFHRRVLSGSWVYRWENSKTPNLQHRYDLFSLNYVYMPWISETFRNEYLEGDDPHYAILRYSYENLFIMKTSYSFVYNSLRDAANSAGGLYQTNGFQIRMGLELAGNLLYGISKATRSSRDSDGKYNLFGIAYSQYVKFDFDFAKSFLLNERNSIATHVAFGIGLPYGNSTILPYEKRYFSGGANSVRGWSVRELGPGAYVGKDGKIDFINQTGNLKLDLSVEFRTFMFWKLHGALFVDAGNIWNTRSYADMKDAQFKFNTFYKQIAVSYGLGFRLNFDYFILRLDGGMKAINPTYTSGARHYPIVHPRFKRDFTIHFAVGLPF